MDMMTRALRLATLCAGLMVLATPEAFAANRGCSAQCNKGSCSSGNTYAECGCCSDGMPYCGSAVNCKDKLATAFTTVAFDVISVGGAESAQAFVDALKVSLQPTDGSTQFIASVSALASAILSGNSDEAQAAQLIAVEKFDGLEEGDDFVALKVALSSLASPGAR
jgi:hypothetical protein